MKKLLLLLLFTIHYFTASAQVYFNPATTSFATGTTPSSVITADFDNDGNNDIATANGGSNNISVLLGTGTGTFGSATNFAVGTGPYVITTADFNGDTIPDLAVCNGGSNNVSVLLGNGAGGFGGAVNFAVATNPRSVTTGDFNGDGNADLATANYGGGNVSILLGTGTGSFGAPVNYAVGIGPRSIVCAKFDADTISDLAVSNEGSNNISILIGTGTGSFGAATNFSVGGTLPRCITAADFNGDTKMDVATSNGSNNISVLLGTGTGSFAAPTLFPAGTTPWCIIHADFNTDGNMDLAVADFGEMYVTVYVGDGSGSFTPTNFRSTVWTVTASPSSLTSADFNNDGKPDLAVTNSAYNSVSPLLSYTPTVGSCPNPMRIVILGASTSFGFGASAIDSGYAYLFRKFIIDSVNGFSSYTNLAHAGYTTYAMQPTGYPAPVAYPVDSSRNITKAISLNPDGVIFNFTTNDVNALIDLDTTIANFKRCTGMLDALGIRYWVTTTQPRNFTGDPVATIAQKKQMLLDLRDTIMTLYPQNYIESYVGFADINGDLLLMYDSGDNTHFNNAGHRKLYNNVRSKMIDSVLCNNSTVAVAEHSALDEVMIFPNPVSDEFNIISAKYKIESITITDVVGKIITAKQLRIDNNATIDFRNVAKGIYFVQVKTKDKTVTGKIIKQ